MNVSARQLAAFLATSPGSIGRFEQAGVLARQRNGKFDLQRSVQRLLTWPVPQFWAIARESVQR